MFNVGFHIGRYRVDDVTQDDREDCYVATLHIDAATATDSRAYYLAVENDKGTDRHAVQLYVNGECSFYLSLTTYCRIYYCKTLIENPSQATMAFAQLILSSRFVSITYQKIFSLLNLFRLTHIKS